MPKERNVVLVFIFCFSAVSTVLAVERPTVAVTFEIAPEHPYAKKFPPQQLSAINAAVTGELKKTLAEEFPLFDFEPAGAPNHLLQVTLDNDPLSTSGVPAVDFVWNIDPANDHDPVAFDYRSADEYGLPIPEAEAFVLELNGRLRRIVTACRHDLVGRLLRYVPVASAAFVVAAQKVFILPFTADDLRIGKESEFGIEAEDKDQLTLHFDAKPAGDSPNSSAIPGPFRAKLRAQATAPAESIMRLTRGEQLTPRAVYVSKYYRRREEPRPTPPSDYDPHAGGGR